MLNILVTGATGFIGGEIVKDLLETGLQHPFTPSEYSIYSKADICVFACGRNEEKGKYLESLGAKFIKVDLGLNEDEFIKAFHTIQQLDIVINCAAKCHYWGKWEEFFRDNIKSTQNLIKLCNKHDSILIQVSSSTIYAEAIPQLNVKESIEPRGNMSYYSRTKKLADDLIQKSYNSFIILRPRAVYGTGDNVILPMLVEKLKKKRVPVIKNTEETLSDMTFVKNFVDAVKCSCVVMLLPNDSEKRKLAQNQIYNISDGKAVFLYQDVVFLVADRLKLEKPKKSIPFSVAWYLAMVVEFIWKFGVNLILPRSMPPLSRQTVATFGCSLTMDISKARNNLGYRGRMETIQGLQQTMDVLVSSKKF